MNPVVSAKTLSKSFSGKRVLTSISLDIFPGDMISLIGANGSGKTTFLRLLAHSLQPTTGRVTLHTSSIGLLLNKPHLYQTLTVRENLQLAAMLLKLAPQEVSQSINQWNLELFADKECRFLSKGEKQRAALAKAFLASPALLLLDEPLQGLDEQSRTFFFDHLERGKTKGMASIITGHEHGPMLSLATRKFSLKDGTLHS